MYDIRPQVAYVMDRTKADPNCLRRVEAMVPAFGNPPVVAASDGDIPDIIAKHDLHNARKRDRQIESGANPIIVFNALRLNGQDIDVDGLWAKCPKGTSKVFVQRLLGFGGISYASSHFRGKELVCRKAYEFNTVEGCPHRCQYCPSAGESVISIALNMEEFIEEKVDPLLKANPRQKVYRFQTQASDSLCIEPEYGAVKALVDYFAEQDDRYLLLHTKSANADFLTDLDHKGHTIALWSLTSHTASREIERGSGTTEERIEAARKCAAAGYPTRFKFKPIIPVRNWREETRQMIRLMFDGPRSDIISLCCMMWMKIDELEAAMDADKFDPEFIKAAHEHADEMTGALAAPFPHHVRAEIYSFFIDEIRKYDKEVPISICTETIAMWREFQDRLGFGPGTYACGCGPECPPGTEILGRDVLKEKNGAA